MTAVIDSINELAADREQAYRDLVIRAADDETIDATEAAEILKAAGKSAGDLQGDIQQHHCREAQRAKIAEYPAIASEWEAAKAELADKCAAFERQHQQHLAEVRPLQFKIGQLQEQVIAHNPRTIEGELFRECPDKKLRSRYEIISARLRRLLQELRVTNDHAASATARLKAAETIPARGWAREGEREPNPDKSAVTGPAYALANYESRARELAEQINTTQTEQGGIHRAMIEA